MSFESIEDVLFYIRYDDLDLRIFETWLYTNNDLEDEIGSDAYLDLISLNYKKKGARYELEHIIEDYVDAGSVETRYVLSLLESCYEVNDKTFDALCNIYDLYCKGYYFMRKMALEYGLWCEVPHSEEHAKAWMNIHDSNMNEIVRPLIPKIKQDAGLLIEVIRLKQVDLTGNITSNGNREYIDIRTEEHKRLTDIGGLP